MLEFIDIGRPVLLEVKSLEEIYNFSIVGSNLTLSVPNGAISVSLTQLLFFVE